VRREGRQAREATERREVFCTRACVSIHRFGHRFVGQEYLLHRETEEPGDLDRERQAGIVFPGLNRADRLPRDGQVIGEVACDQLRSAPHAQRERHTEGFELNPPLKFNGFPDALCPA